MFLGHLDVGRGEAEVLGDLVVDGPGHHLPLLAPVRGGEVVDVLALPRILHRQSLELHTPVATLNCTHYNPRLKD